MRKYSQTDITEISVEQALEHILLRCPELERAEIEKLLGGKETEK